MDILLKSAKIIDPNNKNLHSKKSDIHIKNGKIVQIAANIKTGKGTKAISYKNLHVSAGWFDSGVSFGEPGYEERETIANGLYTAGKSGFTDVVLNPSSTPVPDSSSDIVFLKNAAERSVTQLHPLGTITLKGEGKHLAELFDMKNAGAVAFSDAKRPLENANLLKIALQYSQNFGGLVYSFPMDVQIAGKGIVNEGPNSTRLGLKGIPALAEELQIARDLFILEYTGGKLHIPTLSTAASVKLITQAKKKGLNVSCSVAIHNLCFTDDLLHEYDSNYKTLPPLRPKKDTLALIKAVKDGAIDYVTADHIPMDVEHKRVEFDNAAYGTIGLESAFGTLNRLFDLNTAIALLTKGRERYGLETPRIAEGARANITLFDPTTSYILEKSHLHSSSKNSAFIGSTMKGSVLGVVCNDKAMLN